MYRRTVAEVGAVLAVALSVAILELPGVARASPTNPTLGVTSEPSGSSPSTCGTDLYGQQANDSSTPFLVPPVDSDTTIQSWSSVVTGGTAGGNLTLWVLAPSDGNYTVVGTDSETVPAPLPSSGTVTFTPSSPITVHAGDTFALTGAPAQTCYWYEGDTPSTDSILLTSAPTATTAGQTITPEINGSGAVIDLGVTLTPAMEDASVTAAGQPSSVSAGSLALFTDIVTNAGPGYGPITLTDVVPAGLTIDAASVVGGTCTISGQTVSCSTDSLAVGSAVPAYIVVTTTGSGTFANVADTVVPSATDPNPANDSSSSSLTVVPAPTSSTNTVTKTLTTSAAQSCSVVPLKGTPKALAEKVLKALHCKVGKVRTATSRTVAKGDVIATTPGKGTFAAGRSISLKVSSGKPKPKRRKK